MHHLLGRPPVKVMPGFEFSLAFNTGAAFSFLHDAGGWQNGFFIAVAAVVSVFVVYTLHRLPRGELQTAVALALILGGAVRTNLLRRRAQWTRCTVGIAMPYGTGSLKQ